MRFPALALVGFIPTVFSAMALLKPPAFSGMVEPARNPVRVMGSTVDIQWTPADEGKKLSVVLYQLNATGLANYNGEFHFTAGSFEFITRDSVNITDFRWIVATARDLSESSMFAIALWQEGTQITDSATSIFNITRPEAQACTSITTPTTASLTSAPAATLSVSYSTAPDVAADSGASSPQPSASPLADTGLSAGASAGIGIGVAAAVMILVTAAWFLGLRTGRQQGMAAAAAEYAQPGNTKFTHAGDVRELNAETYVAEVPGLNNRYELASR